MNKTVKTMLAAFVVMACAKSAMAVGTSDTVTVSSSVSTVACSVGLSSNAISIPAAAPAVFTDAVKNSIIAAYSADVTATLSGCSGTVSQAEVASLKISGTTISGNKALFNNDTSGTVGIALAEKTDLNKFLESGSSFVMYTAGANPNVNELEGLSKVFTVGLVSPTASPKGQAVVAPITFTYTYN